MELFQKKSALEREWQKALKQEKKFLEKRFEKKESLLNQKLEAKVPKKVEETLNDAFNKAFALVFEKGTGIIEKTYRKETIEQNHKIQQYAVQVSQSRKSIRVIEKNAGRSGIKNLAVSGVMGIGMGVMGIGLPDIPVFTGMILKSIYEIALRYGYPYDAIEEQFYILLLIQGAVSHGTSIQAINNRINHYMKTEKLMESESVKSEMKVTADLLSKELLYIKFLQGVPVVGAIGGAYDAIYMKKITEYAELKYRQRYLYNQQNHS